MVVAPFVNAATTETLADDLYAKLSAYGMTEADKVKVERYLADNPVTGMESMTEGFTNECNYGGKISYMKNLTGLWILQCLKDEWKASFPQMEAEAQQAESLSAFIDTDDPW